MDRSWFLGGESRGRRNKLNVIIKYLGPIYIIIIIKQLSND